MADKRNLLDRIESFSLMMLLVITAGMCIGVIASFLYWLICG